MSEPGRIVTGDQLRLGHLTRAVLAIGEYVRLGPHAELDAALAALRPVVAPGPSPAATSSRATAPAIDREALGRLAYEAARLGSWDWQTHAEQEYWCRAAEAVARRVAADLQYCQTCGKTLDGYAPAPPAPGVDGPSFYQLRVRAEESIRDTDRGLAHGITIKGRTLLALLDIAEAAVAHLDAVAADGGLYDRTWERLHAACKAVRK